MMAAEKPKPSQSGFESGSEEEVQAKLTQWEERVPCSTRTLPNN